MHSETVLSGNGVKDGAVLIDDNTSIESEEEVLLEDDDELDDDEEDEAEAIAKRLGDQLWADINKAHADRALSTNTQHISQSQNVQISKKAEAAITTMKTILSFAESDALVNSTLTTTFIPGSKGNNVLAVLKSTIASGVLTREVAGPLSHAIVALAKSSELFPPLPTLPPHLQAGKRKRDEHEIEEQPFPKRATCPQLDLKTHLSEATQDIKKTLDDASSSDDKLDPTIISSIQLQLHQVFLFAVTSSSVAKDSQVVSALQEIGGLIQVLGVLSGIQITLNASSADGTSTSSSIAGTSLLQANDIGTAVYPCLSTGCNKIFSRLYSQRQHQRVHSMYRPFKCEKCVASFVRNHDLKRHLKAHGKLAYKCCGCDKVFSRRDAIKRHKGNSKKGAQCAEAAVEVVDIDVTTWNDSLREKRRNKLWDDITSASAAAAGPVNDEGLEEGELTGEAVRDAQEVIIVLRSLLQNRVTSALGSTSVPSISSLSSTLSHATGVVYNSPPMDSLTFSTPQTALVPPASSLPDYGLNEDQTKLLELAIANATAAAQAQAEAEAMLEEEEEGEGDEEDDEEDDDDEGETHDETLVEIVDSN